MILNQIIDQLYIHRFEITLQINQSISFDFFTGALFRSQFLKHAHDIQDNQGTSLYTLLTQLPSQQQQAAKGYNTLFPAQTSDLDRLQLKQGDNYTFTLILIGDTITYFPLFLQTLLSMTTDPEGMFSHTTLIHVEEIGTTQTQTLYTPEQSTLPPPSLPITIREIVPTVPQRCSQAVVRFITPTSLFSSGRSGYSPQSYQARLNGFPSFYQIVRSVCHRLTTLTLQFVTSTSSPSKEQLYELQESYIQDSFAATLVRAQIEYKKLYSTPKQEKNIAYKLQGCVGEIEFADIPTHYIPYLYMATLVGIGGKTNYGLGQFELIPTR